jgi:hypothetical protein
LAIAFIDKATLGGDVLGGFNRIWIVVLVSGIATTLFALPLSPKSVVG